MSDKRRLNDAELELLSRHGLETIDCSDCPLSPEKNNGRSICRELNTSNCSETRAKAIKDEHEMRIDKRIMTLDEFEQECGFSEEFLHETELEYDKAKLVGLLATTRIENKELRALENLHKI